jgi:hypothetical protein
MEPWLKRSTLISGGMTHSARNKLKTRINTGAFLLHRRWKPMKIRPPALISVQVETWKAEPI